MYTDSGFGYTFRSYVLTESELRTESARGYIYAYAKRGEKSQSRPSLAFAQSNNLDEAISPCQSFIMDAFFHIAAPLPHDEPELTTTAPSNYDTSNGSAAWSCTVA